MSFWKKLFGDKDPAEYISYPKIPGMLSFEELAIENEELAKRRADREDYERAKKSYEDAIGCLEREKEILKKMQREYFVNHRKPCRKVFSLAIGDFYEKSRAVGAAEGAGLGSSEYVMNQLSDAVVKASDAIWCLAYEPDLTEEEFEKRTKRFDFDSQG